MVLTVRMANSNVHRMLVDNGSVVDILYWDAYKRTNLTENDLSPTTFRLYRFTRDHMISRGTIKLAVTVGKHPKTLTVMMEFLAIDSPSAFNMVIGRLLLKALKAMTSIYYLTMKFPTAMGTRQVRGGQCDSRECYNRSLELAKKERKLPRMMEIEKVSKEPMETNIDPLLQEEESIAGPIEELVEIQVDPKEPSRVVKVGKCLSGELAKKLANFLHVNQNILSWTHADMVGIHPEVICH